MPDPEMSWHRDEDPYGRSWATAEQIDAARPATEWNPPPQQQPARPPKPRACIEIRPGSRLEQLLERRSELVAELDEAKKRVDAVNAAIKNVAVSSAPPKTEIIDLPAGPYRPGLSLVWAKHSRIDIKSLRRDHNDLCEQYRVQEPRWELRLVKDGGG